MSEAQSERIRQDDEATLGKWRQDLLEHIAQFDELDRTRIIRESVRQHDLYLRATRPPAGLQGSLYRLPRFGPAVLEVISSDYDLQDNDHIKARYEMLRAEITGEFDRQFVDDMFTGERVFQGRELFAINIVVAANCTDYKLRLVEWLDFGIPQATNPGDIPNDLFVYLVRVSAAHALAVLHGREIIGDLESTVIFDPQIPAQFDSVPFLVEELKLRYAER